jgi:hypothetical protein
MNGFLRLDIFDAGVAWPWGAHWNDGNCIRGWRLTRLWLWAFGCLWVWPQTISDGLCHPVKSVRHVKRQGFAVDRIRLNDIGFASLKPVWLGVQRNDGEMNPNAINEDHVMVK